MNEHLFEQLRHFLLMTRTLAVGCMQFGDTGKGKFIDLLMPFFDLNVRGNGGANAGHTVKVGDRLLALHLVPSGILHDADGKINIMGSGMAIDPLTLCHELDQLELASLSYDHLRLSHRALVVLPWHILRDRLSDTGTEKIGTTGRGIGPCYSDQREGLDINDLLNVDVLANKLRANFRHHKPFLAQADPAALANLLKTPALASGSYQSDHDLLNMDAVIESYRQYGQRLAPLVHNTDEEIQEFWRQSKRILLEGAQGLLLSLKHGTRPYVTNCDTSFQGMALGAGLLPEQVDKHLGIIKAYLTRVGRGPFPTELGGQRSDDWCNDPDITRKVEDERFPKADVNSSDNFLSGVALRKKGKEFGTTTARPRRIGWFDVPLLRYARSINGPDLIITKVDVLDECENIPICTRYCYTGAEHLLPGQKLTGGLYLNSVMEPRTEILQHCNTIYTHGPGWQQPTVRLTTMADAPEKLERYLRCIESWSNCTIHLVSVGADREQTIVRSSDPL